MAGNDLNTVEEDEEEGSPVAEPGRGAVCLELWHACAVVYLPQNGSAVVYLPQGHLEHIGDSAGAGSTAAAVVPAHVFCRVVDVNLQADAAMDEVYAQVSLVVDNEEANMRMRDREDEAARDGLRHQHARRLLPSVPCCRGLLPAAGLQPAEAIPGARGQGSSRHRVEVPTYLSRTLWGCSAVPPR